ncbi:MAG TPA: family 10 glycosylhydrolase [Gemmatimonadaceae bacterium]|nr:family 10 glycosylhydrolase [Gemmatimonadaceae bacterium]
MPKNQLCCLALSLFVLAGFETACGQSQVSSVHGLTQPPPAPREFRGVWVASVENIDWPSQPGLSTQEQKDELLGILDRAAALHLNAVILQVRPAADALYASPLEPWSEYLTGQMGKAPNPWYDPLEFAVTEAHRRGLELHAWFNPYRAHHPSGKSRPSANHISVTNPELVKRYGSMLWMDPGEPACKFGC